MHNRLALLEVTPPSLSDWACLTRHLSPLSDTVCGLMSALCANASVSHLLPHYSSNLIHKGAQVTLWGVTHGVCVSITSYLMYLSPLLFFCCICLDEWFLLLFVLHPTENMLVLHVFEPCSHQDFFIMWSLFLCMWSNPSPQPFHFPCWFPFSLHNLYAFFFPTFGYFFLAYFLVFGMIIHRTLLLIFHCHSLQLSV